MNAAAFVGLGAFSPWVVWVRVISVLFREPQPESRGRVCSRRCSLLALSPSSSAPPKRNPDSKHLPLDGTPASHTVAISAQPRWPTHLSPPFLEDSAASWSAATSFRLWPPLWSGTVPPPSAPAAPPPPRGWGPCGVGGRPVRPPTLPAGAPSQGATTALSWGTVCRV